MLLERNRNLARNTRFLKKALNAPMTHDKTRFSLRSNNIKTTALLRINVMFLVFFLYNILVVANCAAGV